jgi:MFS family permease
MKSKLNYTYFAFIWHGFFLALTMSMLDLNTVFPTLINTLHSSKYIFGALYTIMLGVPLIFNVVFSHYLRRYQYKKKFLLLGIYMRGTAFLGMAFFTYYFALSNPTLTIVSFFFFVFMFSISAGFAGLSYSDIIAKTVNKTSRTMLYTYKQFFGSSASFLGGMVIAYIFAREISFPENYAISLGIGFIGLFVASLGFVFLKEPATEEPYDQTKTLGHYIRNIPGIIKSDQSFKRYILIENMSSFSIMILPFYIIFAREVLMIGDEYIGIYLVIQVVGTIVSNIVWGIMAKRFKAKHIVRFCIMLGGLNPLVAILLAQVAPSLFGIVFFIVGFTISGRKIGFEPYLLDIAPDTRRVEYLGIRGSLNIFVIVLPLMGALFINLFGYYLTFILVTLVMLFAVVLMRTVKGEEYEEYC